MRCKVWVSPNVLIIPTSINAKQNFARKEIVNLVLFGKATCEKMVQNLSWASSQYSNLYLQPYFPYLILPGEKYARLSVRLSVVKQQIKNYNNETNIQWFNCNYNHNIRGL
jgi:hypothetical protein